MVYVKHTPDENIFSLVYTTSGYCVTCKIIHQKNARCDGEIYFWISDYFIYSSNTKSSISPSTQINIRIQTGVAHKGQWYVKTEIGMLRLY